MSDTTNYNYGYPVQQPEQHAETSDVTYNKPGIPKPPAGWGKTLGTEVKLAPDMVC